MNIEFIFIRLFLGLLAISVVYMFYACTKFYAAGNSSGYRRWDDPAGWWQRAKTYGAGTMIAAGASSLLFHRYQPHGLDYGVVAFVVLAGASAFGAARGFTRELPPPRSIAEALRRLDPTSPLVHHVPSAEKHLAEAKEFQAKVHASMADLINKVDRHDEG